MSRIGKKLIVVPENVKLTVENNFLKVEGKYGSLERSFLNYVSLKIENHILSVISTLTTKKALAYHGLSRALIYNMIIGVNNQFKRVLVAEGVGYKFQLELDTLSLSVGFSHPMKMQIPKNITATLESSTRLVLASIDKEKLGLFASKIREVRPPEPYKGKGIRYLEEKIRKKAGKTKK